MAEKVISALVEGGKATAGPPIGPALGPLGINAGQVVAEINQKTKDFSGITVPVKIIVDTSTKKYT
ncbi:MAG: 50S ribosomal protein L11, partial [archaeon]